jgi:putative hemolysin
MGEYIRYFVLFALVIMSAFFSASETAFSTVNMIRLKNAKEEGKRGARVAVYVADNFDKTLSAILIGNNIVNIAMASLATIVAIDLVGSEYGPLVATVVTTVFVLLFGEILPKSIAKENALIFTLKFGWLLLFFIRVFTPFTFVVMKIKRLFTRVFDRNKDGSHPSVTEDELEVIIDTMEEEGVIEEEEREMIRSVLDLSETNIYDIMTPRVDMIGVYVDNEIEYIKDLFLEEKYSRMPVYHETKDNVVGILYERDFFSALIKSKDYSQVNVVDIMKPPIFVPKSMHVDALIELLQRSKQHMAIVSDEYGGTSGIVTMEDCLEELVGEIYDEHDEEEYEIKQIDEFNYDLNPSITLEDLFEELDLGKAPETHYNSVGGWLYEQLEEIPSVGDEFIYKSLLKIDHDVTTIEDDQYYELLLTFTVKELHSRRMKTIHLNIVKSELNPKDKVETNGNGKEESSNQDNE